MNADSRPSVAAYAAQAKQHQQRGDDQAAMRSYLIATHLQMLALNPLDAAACFQLGMAFGQAGEEANAAAAFRAAIVAQPAFPDACNNLGILSTGEPSVTCLRHAVHLSPGRADYHTNLAHGLLSAGRLAEGFREWEWRRPSPPRDFTQPLWDGGNFAGKTLLVHAEQGFGDSIQFARYVPLAAAKGGQVIVETRSPLAGLLRRIPGVAATVEWGAPLPPFDLHIPLPSLAARFPVPPPGSYLSADPTRQTPWRGRLAANGKRNKVGLVWSGNPRGHDRRRAAPFEALAAMAEAHPDIAFFALQRDSAETCPAITPLGHAIEDFDDLAAALGSLDLLISVDTAAAHLAGALGHKVWVMLHSAADWRWWGPDAAHSIWYPTARLYRQSRPGDWQEVIERVGTDLRRPL